MMKNIKLMAMENPIYIAMIKMLRIMIRLEQHIRIRKSLAIPNKQQK